MAAGDGARAWNLMHSITRRDVYRDSRADFLGDVEAANWDGFDWQVEPPRFSDVHYLADVEVPNGLGLLVSDPGVDCGLAPSMRSRRPWSPEALPAEPSSRPAVTCRC